MNVSWDDGDGEHDDTADGDRVRELIGSLDGEDRTHVSVGDAELHLVCGGSAKDGLVLYIGRADEIHQLVSTARTGDDEKVELVAAGQPGEYPARFVVDLASARKAAKAFVEDGSVESTLTWERQD